MSQTQQFNDYIKRGEISPDDAQSKAIEKFEEIHHSLIETKHRLPIKFEENKQDQSAWNGFRSLFKRKQSKAAPSRFPDNIIRGMYIWGDVGRGKTWLMDQFYASLSIERKQRIHFHQFMQQVHQKLEDLPTQPDPLEIIGHDMAAKYRLICLDEFHVMDIADAVILHGLLRALFEGGVTLITTSNRHPDELYKNGSRRERFLPAIELIKQFTHVFHLDSGQDYRLERGIRENTYFFPHDVQVQSMLLEIFNSYSTQQAIITNPIIIENREIPVVKRAKKAIWFTFDTLCRGMRASSDYIAIAEQYPVIILSQIPLLKEGEEGPARRFLNLIDAFYDQHVFLVLSSTNEIKNMYQGNLLGFEFERALSRLNEMQSSSWWKNVDSTLENKLEVSL